MRKRLFFMLSLVLVFALSSSVYAQVQFGALHSDPTDDSLLSTVEIAYYGLQVFDSDGDGRYMKLTLNMGGTKLPGMVLLDLDVDNDLNTGSSRSMTGISQIFPPCLDCGPTNVLKLATEGPDIHISIYLRDQLDTSRTAWGEACTGPAGTCMVPGDFCTGHTGCDALKKGAGACIVGDDPCYLAYPGNSVTDCGAQADDTCYDMSGGMEGANACLANTDCGRGRWHGEYYASDYNDEFNDSSIAPYRGRIEMPLPPGEGSTDELVIILPLDAILDAVEANGACPDGRLCNQAHYDYDEGKARQSEYLRYQVVAFQNTVEANDFLADEDSQGGSSMCSPQTRLCISAVDVAPNWAEGPGFTHLQEAAILSGDAVDCKTDANEDGKAGLDDQSLLTKTINSMLEECKNTTPYLGY